MTLTLTHHQSTHDTSAHDTIGSRSAVAARAVDATKVYGTRRSRGAGARRRHRRLRDRVASPPSWAHRAPASRRSCTRSPDSIGSRRGSVWIGDVELGRLKEKKLTKLRRDRIGFIFQAFNLIPTLTAAENIVLPMRLAGRKPDQDWLDHVVDTVGLRNRLSHRPSELSGGQQQRVAVARALAGQPHIIFADEPTGNLDSRTGAEILSFMRQAVREFGQTIVMVTHDPVAAAYADRAVFLADGRIVDDLDQPTADSVFDRMRTLGA